MKVSKISVVLLVMWLSGCGENQYNRNAIVQSTTITDLVARVMPEGEVAYFIKDGVQITEQQVHNLANQILQQDSGEVTFAIIKGESHRWQIGKYYCKVYVDKHYVGGCIKRNVTHLNLLIKDNSVKPEKLLLDMHVAVWWDKYPQAGMYNSANKWCVTTQGKFTAIKDAVYEGIKYSTPIPNSIAYAIAYTVALIVVAYFALA